MFELTVTVKGDSQTLNRKYLCYEENITLNYDNEYLKEVIESTVQDFNGSVDDVILKIRMDWQ